MHRQCLGPDSFFIVVHLTEKHASLFPRSWSLRTWRPSFTAYTRSSLPKWPRWIPSSSTIKVSRRSTCAAARNIRVHSLILCTISMDISSSCYFCTNLLNPEGRLRNTLSRWYFDMHRVMISFLPTNMINHVLNLNSYGLCSKADVDIRHYKLMHELHLTILQGKTGETLRLSAVISTKLLCSFALLFIRCLRPLDLAQSIIASHIRIRF